MNLEGESTMKNKVRRNIKLEYIMRFVEYFSVTEAIWVLYLAYKGFPVWEQYLVKDLLSG